MHKKSKVTFIILVLLVLFLIPSVSADAKVQNFDSLYLEVTVPEDTIIVSADTPNVDELWSKIGINDPKEEKKTLEQMGVQAILFDPGTNTGVKLIQNRSAKSSEVFNLSLLSEAEVQDFLDNLISSSDESTTFHIETYPQQELPFFRVELEMNREDVIAREIIYGTVVNGYVISYDIYKENAAEPLDESYIKALVEGTHFTEFLDKAEVERQGRQAMIVLVTGAGVMIAIVVLLIVLSVRRNKRREIVRKERSAMLTGFFQEQKLKEEQHIKDPVLYTNRTEYSEEAIKQYCFYDAVFHHIKVWIMTAAVYILLLIMLYNSSQAIIGYIISTVVVFFLVYFQGLQIEKNAKKILKTYSNSKSKEAVIQFYEDYYTLSGIQSTSKNPYLQITEWREYKNYIYLYLGADRAVYLKKDGFDSDYEEVKTFIRNKIKIK